MRIGSTCKIPKVCVSMQSELFLLFCIHIENDNNVYRSDTNASGGKSITTFNSYDKRQKLSLSDGNNKTPSTHSLNS